MAKSLNKKNSNKSGGKINEGGTDRDNILLDVESEDVDSGTVDLRSLEDQADVLHIPKKKKRKPRDADIEEMVRRKIEKSINRGGSERRKSDIPDDRLLKPGQKLRTVDYLQLILPLHVELLKFQNWVKNDNMRVTALFEGRDAAGKGGTIKRFIEHMNPRGCRVVALNKPTEVERNQWYFQRYITHLPTAGEIVLFDRSWYNRAMVERVMGFCEEAEVDEFMREAPDLERMLVRSGIHLTKFYFSVSKEEQKRRFERRLNDPLKQWKLSPVDMESQDKWDAYTVAKTQMFHNTSTADCPWTIIKSDDKKRARINAIRYFLNQFAYPQKQTSLLQVDRSIVRTVEEELAVED